MTGATSKRKIPVIFGRRSLPVIAKPSPSDDEATPNLRHIARSPRLIAEIREFEQRFSSAVRFLFTMTKNIALSRPAMSAIAAFVVLSTPAFAQEAPTVTMTPPVAPTSIPAPAPTPPTASPQVAPVAVPAPQPVIRVPVDIAPSQPAPKAAEPKAAPAAAQAKRAAPKPRAAQPAATTEARAVEAPTPAPAAAAPIVDETAPSVIPDASVVEPVADVAPAPVAQAANDGDVLPWQIGGGAAVLLLVGGIGLAVARRRRASSEIWEFDDAPADAEWVPGAAAMTPTPEPQPAIQSQSTPSFAAAPSGSMGRHEAMAMAGPTPDNPFATLQKRLARARFLDRQEREQYDAALAEQKDMRRKPVSAWEVSLRDPPAAPAEQEVRRLEPGRTRRELKPGWTKS